MSLQTMINKIEDTQLCKDIIRINHDWYYVPSTEGQICYKVMVSEDGREYCSCKEYAKNMKSDPMLKCKHVLAVINAIKTVEFQDIDYLASIKPVLDERFIINIQGNDFVVYAGLLDLAHQKKLHKLEISVLRITNKFEIITGFIKKLSKYHGKDFDDWFENFLTSYCNNEPDRFNILKINIPKIKKFVNDYIDHLGTDFSKFVDESKIKSNTIVFSKEENESICKVSGYLKVYAIIFNSENICLDKEAHKNIYNKIIDDKSLKVTGKIFNVVRAKRYKSKSTDRSMWDYIEKTQYKPIDYYLNKIFDSIMNNSLVLCEVNRNPITFFIGCIDNAINWILRSCYEQTIVYVDSTNFDDVDSTNFENRKTKKKKGKKEKRK